MEEAVKKAVAESVNAKKAEAAPAADCCPELKGRIEKIEQRLDSMEKSIAEIKKKLPQ